MEELIAKLKEICTKAAERVAWSDDKEFMVGDYAAGNFDDAYFGGCNDGETLLARQVLEAIKESE